MAESKKSLFPVFDVPATLAEDAGKQERYAPAPMWDVERGDFVTDGTQRTLYGSGSDAWVLWCTKSILTQRCAHDSYSADTGIEAEQAFKETDRKAVESTFERTITEALLADPMGRTVQVRDFAFRWEADSLWIECVVFGRDGNTANVRAKLDI